MFVHLQDILTPFSYFNHLNPLYLQGWSPQHSQAAVKKHGNETWFHHYGPFIREKFVGYKSSEFGRNMALCVQFLLHHFLAQKKGLHALDVPGSNVLPHKWTMNYGFTILQHIMENSQSSNCWLIRTNSALVNLKVLPTTRWSSKYFIRAFSMLRRWTSGKEPYTEVCEDVYFGGWPHSANKFPPSSPDIVNCTCEFPRNPELKGHPYLCVPTWDTRSPQPGEIESAVKWALRKRAQDKPVFIHCAYGMCILAFLCCQRITICNALSICGVVFPRS